MCRIRFGLAGIQLDDLEICQPFDVLEEVYQPLISHVPLNVRGKSLLNHTKSSIASKACVADKHPQGINNGHPALTPRTSFPISSSLSPTSDDGGPNKQVLIKPEIASPPSPAPTSASPQNGETKEAQSSTIKTQAGEVQDSTKEVIKERPHKQVRFVNSASTNRYSSSPFITSPNKQVRFSNMVEQRTIPSDDTSNVDSESSFNSFTDSILLSLEAKNSLTSSSLAELLHLSAAPQVLNPMSNVNGYPTAGYSKVDTGVRWKSAKVRDQNGPLAKNSPSTSPTTKSSGSSCDVDSSIEQNVQSREETRFQRQQALSPLKSSSSKARKFRAQA